MILKYGSACSVCDKQNGLTVFVLLFLKVHLLYAKTREACWIHIAGQLEVSQEITSVKRPKCFSASVWHLTSAKMGWTSHLALHWTKQTVRTVCKCYLTLMCSAAQLGVHHPQVHVIVSKINCLWAGGPLLLGVRRWLTEYVLGSRMCEGAWVCVLCVCVSSDDVMSVCTFELFSYCVWGCVYE